jgi:hypothetical protein
MRKLSLIAVSILCTLSACAWGPRGLGKSDVIFVDRQEVQAFAMTGDWSAYCVESKPSASGSTLCFPYIINGRVLLGPTPPRRERVIGDQRLEAVGRDELLRTSGVDGATCRCGTFQTRSQFLSAAGIDTTRTP